MNSITDRLNQLKPYCFSFSDATRFEHAFTRNGYDEAPFNAFSYGGIGTGNFGRDLHGHFSRWHFQNGYHLKQVIDDVRLGLRISSGERTTYHHVGTKGWRRPLPDQAHTVHCLFPMRWEEIAHETMPVKITLESFSPVCAHDYESSSLPVVYFDFEVENISQESQKVDLAFFWTNFLGFRASSRSPREREQQTWPDLSHAGCIHSPIDSLPGWDQEVCGIRFSKNPELPVRRDMEGEMLLAAYGSHGVRFSRELQCMQFSNLCPAWYPNIKKKYTIEDAENTLIATGSLPGHETVWKSHGFEPVGGAVSCGKSCSPGEKIRISFVLVWDMPLVEFGSGRIWEKKYCAHFGAEGRNAAKLAAHALQNKAKYRQAIHDWQTTVVREFTQDPARTVSNEVAGMTLNELYYAVDGGSCWVSKARKHPDLPKPCLGSGEHFTLLEGFDTGYYYYGTEDLWPHACIAFMRNWPHLAGLFFQDFIGAIPQEVAALRPIFKTATLAPLKARWKVPHDLGTPHEDPWHLMNSYNYENNSNLWKDHNPSLISALHLFKKMTGTELTLREWKILKKTAGYFLKQDKDGDGLPEHDAFGDTTFDAMEMKGVGAYSGGFSLAALAAMKAWAGAMNDRVAEARYAAKLAKAKEAYNRILWNGRYYKLDQCGKCSPWLQADALLGPYLALRSGLGDLLPRERIVSHLKAIYELNFKGYCEGKLGPALVGRPAGQTAEEGMQIGEVLVGSAWVCTAMMRTYGLHAEAGEMANTLHRLLHVESGLQFMTPAAWNSRREYRAPLNMRPLAIWFLSDGTAGR